MSDSIATISIGEDVSRATSGRLTAAIAQAGFEVRETENPDIIEVHER